jgi:hypothetical protein
MIEITLQEVVSKICLSIAEMVDELPIAHTIISELGADDLIFKEDVLELLRRDNGY